MRKSWYLVAYGEKSYKSAQILQIYFEQFEKNCEIFFDNPLRHDKMWASSILLIWLNREFLSQSDTHYQIISTSET